MAQFRLSIKPLGSSYNNARVEVSAQGKTYPLSPISVTEDLGQLALKIIDLLRVPDLQEVTVSWVELLVEARWVISRSQDNVTIKIYDLPHAKRHGDLSNESPAFETDFTLFRLATHIKEHIFQMLNAFRKSEYGYVSDRKFLDETLEELSQRIVLYKKTRDA